MHIPCDIGLGLQFDIFGPVHWPITVPLTTACETLISPSIWAFSLNTKVLG
jgi:hypothetical protein